MPRPVLYVSAWCAATAVTATVAWAAVRLAGEQTGLEAMAPLSASQVVALATSTTSWPSTTSEGTTTTAASSHSTTTVAVSSTTGVVTTTDGAEPTVVARVVGGGTLVVSLAGGRLALVGATPAPGFTVDVEKADPAEVLVEFDGGTSHFGVRAFVLNGEVAFEVVGDGDDGD